MTQRTQLNIDISRELKRALKHKAVDRDQSLADYIRKVLEKNAGLSKRRRGRPKKERKA